MTIVSLLFTLLSFSMQSAQPAIVPVGQEPRHHVKFQNRYVRVIDAIIPPGNVTLFHTHSADNIPVAIDGGDLRTVLVGSSDPPSNSTVERGRTWWAPAAYSHQITNTGKNTVRFIDAEILASPGPVADAPSLAEIPGHSLLFENERVRVYRIILQPGQTSGLHKHGRSYLNVPISGGSLEVESPGKKPRPTRVKPGAFAWFDGPLSHSVKNSGAVAYEAVDIELK
ncbi:MAG: hypothetical protein ABI882_00615 [Acidobacteriota bacterium]